MFRSEEGWVQVDYGTGNIPIPRSKYEGNGYKPDFDKLPSEAEYWAAEKRKKMMPRGPKGEKRIACEASPSSHCRLDCGTGSVSIHWYLDL
jgi:hypothetical protein